MLPKILQVTNRYILVEILCKMNLIINIKDKYTKAFLIVEMPDNCKMWLRLSKKHLTHPVQYSLTQTQCLLPYCWRKWSTFIFLLNIIYLILKTSLYCVRETWKGFGTPGLHCPRVVCLFWCSPLEGSYFNCRESIRNYCKNISAWSPISMSHF